MANQSITVRTIRAIKPDKNGTFTSGTNPVEAKREAKRKKEALNFSAYCDRFVELYLRENWRGTWKAARHTLHNVVIPRWRDRAINEITRADIVKVMDGYSDRPARRKEIHSVLRKLFNWATDREDIKVSPLAGMKAPKAVPARRRVLNDEEHVIPLSDLAVKELERLSPRRKGLIFTTTGTTPVSGFFKGKASPNEDMIAHMKARHDRKRWLPSTGIASQVASA